MRSAGAPASARRRPLALVIAWRCALGSGAWSLTWLALGLAGLYQTRTALIALVAGLALAALAIARNREPARVDAPDERAPSPAAAVFALLTALPVALALVSALAPPTAKDALQYHLALPKAYLEMGALGDVPGNLANYFALGAEMHGVWAMLAGRALSARAGEAAFGAIAFAFFPLLLAAVYGWARERGIGRDWAWLATALVAGVPAAGEVAGGGYVDLALAFYVLFAVRAAAGWWVERDRGSLAAGAVALGFALSVKLTALFAVSFFALVALARAALDPGPRRRIGAAVLAIAAAVAIGSPWYVRTWVRTGSPVFPFFPEVWSGRAPSWDPERSALLHGFNALYGGADKGPLELLVAPVRLSLVGQREVAAAYEGVLGIGFLAAAALIVWALVRKVLDRQLAVAAAGGAALFACWAVSAQVLRYLLPALPPLAVSGAGAAAALAATGVSGRAIGWAMAAAVAAAEVVSVAWFVADNPLLAASGAEPRAAYLERRLDYYPYYTLIDRDLPRDANVWLVDMRRDVYHLNRPYTGDYLFEDYTLRRWIEEAATGRDVQERARAAGITHVLIRYDVLFDYAHSPLVDDRRSREENTARLERLRAFLTDGTQPLRGDRKFLLVALPPRR